MESEKMHKEDDIIAIMHAAQVGDHQEEIAHHDAVPAQQTPEKITQQSEVDATAVMQEGQLEDIEPIPQLVERDISRVVEIGTGILERLATEPQPGFLNRILAPIRVGLFGHPPFENLPPDERDEQICKLLSTETIEALLDGKKLPSNEEREILMPEAAKVAAALFEATRNDYVAYSTIVESLKKNKLPVNRKRKKVSSRGGGKDDNFAAALAVTLFAHRND